MSIVFRKPGAYNNKKYYPQGGKKRRIGRGVRQITKLSNDVLALKDTVNTEYKYFDDNQQFTSVPYITSGGAGSAMLLTLNDVPQGTGVSYRDGATVRVKSLQHSCTIDNSLDNAQPCRVRMIFFLQLRPLAAATASNILSNLLTLGSIDPINAFRNLDQRSEYSILSDKVFKLDVSAPNHMVEYEFYKRMNFHTQWTGNDTTGTAIRKNALYCVVFCDQQAAVLPRIRCSTRIRYIDN